MSQSKARLVTPLVIEFVDPADAPVFAEAVKLTLKRSIEWTETPR